MGKDKKQYVTQNQQQSGRQFGSTTGSQMGGFTNMQGIDPGSQAYVDWQRQLAQSGAGAMLGLPGTPGPNAGMLAALQGMSGIKPADMGAFGSGLTSALSQAYSSEPVKASALGLMNPYIQAVVDPTRAEYDRMRAVGRQEIGDAAARAGAFGGSRHGVAEGVHRGELDRAQAGAIADLMRGGYDKALDVATQLQLKRGAALAGVGGTMGNLSALDLERQRLEMQRQQQLFGNYDYLRQIQQMQGMDPMQRYQMALQFANLGLGPVGYQQTGSQYGNQAGTFNQGYSGSTTGKTTQVQPGNFWTDLLGAGLTLGGGLLGGPAGAVLPNIVRPGSMAHTLPSLQAPSLNV